MGKLGRRIAQFDDAFFARANRAHYLRHGWQQSPGEEALARAERKEGSTGFHAGFAIVYFVTGGLQVGFGIHNGANTNHGGGQLVIGLLFLGTAIIHAVRARSAYQARCQREAVDENAEFPSVERPTGTG